VKEGAQTGTDDAGVERSLGETLKNVCSEETLRDWCLDIGKGWDFSVEEPRISPTPTTTS
jgi:hypothetical protein